MEEREKLQNKEEGTDEGKVGEILLVITDQFKSRALISLS